MSDLALGIGMTSAIIAVAIWLFCFHLYEVLVVYGISFAVGIIFGIRIYIIYLRTKELP